MKRLSKLALLLLVLAVSIFATVACGDSVEEVSVKAEGMPQLVFVLGEQIDLSNGLLTVTDKDGTRDIPMDSEGVSVSGYDKNKLGEQTITVSYGSKSTELKVTVVERMTVVNVATDYLVGDELDLTKGSVKITRNDGTSYTVKLNSSNVTLSGFNSAGVGKTTVSVSYDTGAETYNTSFDANIHNVSEIEFKRPNNVAYDSHDGGELDLSGGYLTLKGGNGAVEKDIPLNADSVTVEGFDLSAVNAENTPYTQTITVSYGDKSFEYEVKLTYTDISLFRDNAEKFLDIDWTGEDFPEIGEELGRLAIELMELYLDFSKADMTSITRQHTLAVARAAFVYGLEAVTDDLLALEGAFTISGGQLVFTCESYEDVEDALGILKLYDGDLYTVSPIINALSETFAEEELISDIYFGMYGVLDNEVYEALVDIFEYMLDLSDTLNAIPEDWRTQGVNAYATEIEALWSFIQSSDYTDVSASEIHYYVSFWRTESDLFDLLYTYYFGLNDTETISELALLGLPTVIEDIYYHASAAMDQIYQISQYAVIDTAQLFFSYFYAQKLGEDIMNGEDEMAKYLYENLPLNAMLGIDDSVVYTFDMLIEYIRTAEGGIQYTMGPLLGVPEYHALLDKYMDILINLVEDEDYEDSDRYGADVEEMFALYIDLSAGQQINFFYSIGTFYAMGYPPVMFDDSGDWEDFVNLFVELINDYYRGVLATDAAISVYNQFVIAIELYAQRGVYDTSFDEFIEKMDAIATAYAALSDSERDTFNSYLGSAYEKYTAIRAGFNTTGKVELGEWQQVFDALEEALGSVEAAYSLLQEGYDAYNLFLSAYERLQSIVNTILENAPQDIVDAYYHEAFYGFEYDPGDGSGMQSVAYTYDYVINSYRSLYISCLILFQGYNNIYDMYVEYNMGEFFNTMYDLVWRYLLADPEDPDAPAFDPETALDVLKQFTNLTDEQQVLFIMMEGEDGFYYAVIGQFFEELFTENAMNAAYKLLELEQQMLMYVVLEDAESIEALETCYTELETLYSALAGEDKTSFAVLEELYETITEKYETLIAEIGAAA